MTRHLIKLTDYPHLFQEVFWDWGQMHAQFELMDAPPSSGLISNVNLVPFVEENCLILRLENGSWEIPGGTLELGETYLEAIQRELLEEAGARLLKFEPLGAWKCRSDAPQAFRPHLPHPQSYRFVGYGEVELVGKPSNPADGTIWRSCISWRLRCGG